MSEAIITVENLGKKYSLRHETGERYTALRDVIANKAASLFRRNGRKARRRDNETTGQQTRSRSQWSVVQWSCFERRFLGSQKCFFRSPTRGSRWHHWPERRGQIHVTKDSFANH